MRQRFLPLCLVFTFLPTLFLRADEAATQKYKPLIEAMRKWLAEEIVDKGIPALSWALVDDQELIWAEGHGFQDPAAKTSATGDTVYRVGSVSKPVTALLLMMLVEQGKLDLDAPVQTYLPEFRPKNTSGKQVTLRQMLAHRRLGRHRQKRRVVRFAPFAQQQPRRAQRDCHRYRLRSRRR